jgi:hypothetical protein
MKSLTKQVQPFQAASQPQSVVQEKSIQGTRKNVSFHLKPVLGLQQVAEAAK